MSIRKFLIAMAVAAVATGALALSPEYTDWGKGPATYFMTREEQSQWKAVKTDEEAKKFVDLFWARRDPSPGTPQNEFKDEFEARVKYADEKFSAGRRKGSMTDRGKTLIIFGPPSKIERSAAANRPQAGAVTDPEEVSLIWLYDSPDAQKNFGIARAELRFVDRFGNEDFRLETGRVNIAKAQEKIVAAAITQPNLTEAPRAAAAAPAAPAPAAVATPAAPATVPIPPLDAPATEFKTAAFKTAVADFRAAKKSPYDKPMHVTWGEFVTGAGEYFVPISVYVPKSAGLAAGAGLTFFGAVEDASGKTVAAFEEPVTLTATKDDLYFDKSVTLPAGKFKGTFGLADASGKPVTMVSSDMELAGAIDKAVEGTSKLILSNNIFPMTEAQLPTEPYAFGGLKVIPKGDKTFSQADDLWYFIEIRNPGLGEDQKPKIQTKIDVEGKATDGKTIKMSAPPSEATTTEFRGMPGHWGIGSAIPLATFKPGTYNISIKVMDTVNKTSYTVKNDFIVVPGAAAPAAQ